MSNATVNANVRLSLAASNTALVIGGNSTAQLQCTQSLPNVVLAGGTLGGAAPVTITGPFNVTVSGSTLAGPGFVHDPGCRPP